MNGQTLNTVKNDFQLSFGKIPNGTILAMNGHIIYPANNVFIYDMYVIRSSTIPTKSSAISCKSRIQDNRKRENGEIGMKNCDGITKTATRTRWRKF